MCFSENCPRGYFISTRWHLKICLFRIPVFQICPFQKPQRASVTKKARKMLSYVTFCVLYELFGENRTQKANKAIFSTNLSIYMAAKKGIWFMLSWKCFFTLCEVDYFRMNGKVRRAGGTWSVSSCPICNAWFIDYLTPFFFQFLCLVGTEISSSVKKGRVKRGKSDLTFWRKLYDAL